MNREIIMDAIVRANKLGAKGIQVVDYMEPATAAEGPGLKLVVRVPEIANTDEVPWYEK